MGPVVGERRTRTVTVESGTYTAKDVMAIALLSTPPDAKRG